MTYTIREYINIIRSDREKQRKIAYLIFVLSIFVAGGISWKLHLTGITMSNTACCGKLEHTHTEECAEAKTLVCTLEETVGHTHTEECYQSNIIYLCGMEEGQETVLHTHAPECYEQTMNIICTDESPEHIHSEWCFEYGQNLICTLPETQVHFHSEACPTTVEQLLICGLEESGHTHTDACYEIKMSCDKEEHVHTIACYSDPNADVETADMWKATLPATLSGKWNKDILAVAASQLGYTESDNNFEVSENGDSYHGYTRYGAWYGNTYGRWNAMFVSFCLHYSNFPVEAAPVNSGAAAMLTAWQEKGLAVFDSPAAGDLIFLDRDGDLNCDDVAIIAEIIPDVGTKIIGHDAATKSVAEQIITDGILAYGSMEKAFDLAVSLGLANPIEEEKQELPDDGMFPEECPEGYSYYEASYSEGLFVQVYAPDEAFIQPVQLFASLYSPESEEHLAAEERLTSVGAVAEDDKLITLDIHFANEYGEEIEPLATAGKVFVRFMAATGSGEDEEENDNIFRYEIIEPDGTVSGGNTETPEYEAEVINAEEVVDDGIITEDTPQLFAAAAPGMASEEEFTEIIPEEAPTIYNSEGAAPVSVFHITDSGVIVNVAGGSSETGAAAEIRDEVYAEFTVTEFSTFVVDKTDDNKNKDVNSLQEAIDNASNGAIIKLQDNWTFTGQVTVPSGKNVVIDLNGYTLNVNGNITAGNYLSPQYLAPLKVEGALTIMDSGTDGKIQGKGNDANNQVHAALIEVYAGASLTINGGTLCDNYNFSYGNRGGAVALLGNWYNRANFTMNAGTIKNCTITGNNTVSNGSSVDAKSLDGGMYPEQSGGAILAAHANVKITGGLIDGNKANLSGGGIYIFGDSYYEMIGGTISNNVAQYREGGGITLGYGEGWKNDWWEVTVKGKITGGHIVDNHTYTNIDWGGGGIFVANGAELTLQNACVTNNTASGYGGGITACPTGNTEITGTSAGAIYSNTANGNATSVSDKYYDHDWKKAVDNGTVMLAYCQDFYSSDGGAINGTMMGLGSQNWTLTDIYGNLSTIGKGGTTVIPLQNQFAMTANPTQADINTSKLYTSVYITGNTSGTHGGGILNNGILKMGSQGSSYSPYEFTVKKNVTGIDPRTDTTLAKDGFEFDYSMVTTSGSSETIKNLSTLKSDVNGDIKGVITYEMLNNDLNKTYVFQLTEKKGTDNLIEYDTAKYRLYIKLKDTVLVANGQGATVTYHQLDVDPAGPNYWKKYDENSKTWVRISGTPTFENKIKTGSLKVQKLVPDFSTTEDFEFKGQLYKAKNANFTTDVPQADYTFYIAINGGTPKEYKTDKNGQFSFKLKKDETAILSGLPIGSNVELTESAQGYITTWVVDPKVGTAVGTKARVQIELDDKTNNTKEITCKNVVCVELPKTGGIGTAPFLLLGTVLIAYSLLTLIKKKNKANT